jgi:hypothetical protein
MFRPVGDAGDLARRLGGALLGTGRPGDRPERKKSSRG